MLIDTHAHLNFNAFKDDADEVIRRTLANDVWVINIGSQLATSKKAIELAEKYPQGVFAAVGLHPIHLTGHLMKKGLDAEELAAQEKIGEFNIEDYRKLVLSPRGRRVVAIGEIGLDYYWRPKSKAKLNRFKDLQKQGLLSQMDLANELNLPIVFHCRAAHNDLIDILNVRHGFRGVVHCFTGTIEQMEQYLHLGLYLGFNGIIFKSIPGLSEWQQIIKTVPLNRILAETDSPYLGRSVSIRNEPLFVKEVIKEIARIKNLSYQEVSETTGKNTRELFKI